MINGFYLINKKAGVTSSWVTQEVKRKFGYKKVGHLGTLDPMAQGLLILAVNRATKFGVLDPKPGDLGMTRMKVW